MFLHKVGDVVVNLPLPLGNRHAAIVGEGKANVKGEGNYPLTVGNLNLRLVDERFGDGPRYYLTEPKDIDMRVPDQIRKSVVFIGVVGDLPEVEWKATAYIVAVPDALRVFREEDDEIVSTTTYPFTFIATARHVAEKLEGKEFALRVNKIGGGFAVIRGQSDTKWWYHPTEKKYVDAALAMFTPENFMELDIHTIHIDLFADKKRIADCNIGAGDEVFVAGLFTEITETTENIPVVRIGNLAAMPNERIPFKDGKLIDAYLVETRSIGGLSGSPVFVRETIKLQVHQASGKVLNSAGKPLPENHTVELSGLGKIYFLGSMIGHWDSPTDFAFPHHEAVNMGISPIVPAHKIQEILTQPELLDMVKKVNKEIAIAKHSNATYDFAPEEKEEKFTREDFEAALKKASRKVKQGS